MLCFQIGEGHICCKKGKNWEHLAWEIITILLQIVKMDIFGISKAQELGSTYFSLILHGSLPALVTEHSAV